MPGSRYSDNLCFQGCGGTCNFLCSLAASFNELFPQMKLTDWKHWAEYPSCYLASRGCVLSRVADLGEDQPEAFVILESSMLFYPSGLAHQAGLLGMTFPTLSVLVNVSLTFFVTLVIAFGESFLKIQFNLPLIPLCPSLNTLWTSQLLSYKTGWSS